MQFADSGVHLKYRRLGFLSVFQVSRTNWIWLSASSIDPVTQWYIHSLSFSSYGYKVVQQCHGEQPAHRLHSCSWILQNPWNQYRRFLVFFKIRGTTLKVYTLFLHILSAEIHVDLILSVHGDEGGDAVYFISFFIGPHKRKYCVKYFKNLGSNPAVTYIDLEWLCWSFNDRIMPINFSKCLEKCVA